MSTLEVGATLGGYRILARLRAGSMGALYLARRVGTAEFSRPVAIKVIHDHLVQNERFRRMFTDEARLSARIDHPNVVRVEEFGVSEGRTYLVMELVNGISLAHAMGLLQAFGRIPIEIAVAIAIEIAGGLHGAHEATDDAGVPLGIVHRDVSPQNVLVSYTGSVRVVDFGIAKAGQSGGQTNTGSLRGKLAYMPPEQAKSARTVDRRADLYGLGLVLWEMLTSRRVYDASNDIALFDQIRNPVIVPPSTLAPDIPPALDDVLLRTLALDPDSRPPTGLALQRGLGNALPAALRVQPSDIAALMQKVRAQATSLAEGAEDPSGLYGEEIRRTLTIVGKHLRFRSDGTYDLAADDSLDTLPQPPRHRRDTSPSVIIAGGEEAIVEEESTLRNAPPPVEALPVHAPPPLRAAPPPIVASGFESKQVLFVVVPVAAAALIGIALVVGQNETPLVVPRAAPVVSSAPVSVPVPAPPIGIVTGQLSVAGPDPELPPAPSPSPPRVRVQKDDGGPRLPAGLPLSRE